MSITEFLLARIAEDEAVVAYAEPHEKAGGYNYADVGGLSEVLTVGTDRVLAECAAKRAIVVSQQSFASVSDDASSGVGTRMTANGAAEGLRIAAQLLATVYKDHPDYDPEWAL